jgi:hypothetical protein
MPYDRDSRYDRDDDYGMSERGDYGPSFGPSRENSYSSAREYQAAGQYGGRGRTDQPRGRYGQPSHGRPDHDRADYGARDYGSQHYAQGEQGGYRQSSYDRPGSDRSSDGRSDHGQSGYGRSSYGQSGYGQGYGRQPQDRGDAYRGRDQGRPSDAHNDERGFFDRAGDEVRSWLGDEEAERRRDMDQRHAEQIGQTGRARHDDDYHSWRSSQISSLDRDYDEYRRENRTKFEKEFSDWRSNRQTQRQSLSKVTEHQEVVGSDGQHIGTVDKVRGDRIILTKTDKDAGGQHHSVPCSWITSVDDKVTLNKSADQAKQAWRDEEENGAMFGRGEQRDGEGGVPTDRNLNRSFSGTY